MTLPYREGSWFAVPLRHGGFAVGLLARMSASGKIVLCYFFGPRRAEVPPIAQLDALEKSQAIRVLRVGDLSLLKGEWPIIGQSAVWNRSDWPVPAFVRKDDLSRRAWRVQYDDDPSILVREHPEAFETTLERDALYGAGAAELVLTGLLA